MRPRKPHLPSRALPIPAAAAPAPGSAGWCWRPRTAFSASMSDRASAARPASSPARAPAWSATTTIRRGCILPISTRRKTIGRNAGERAVRRLNARKAKTGPVDVVFDPRVARGIAGHLAGAINGASVARKTSFLRDMMGKQVAAAAITVTDEPLRPRGQASRPFDGEGVEGEKLLMVEKGVLNHWFLSTSAARELGLRDQWSRRARRLVGVAVLDQFCHRSRATSRRKT